MSRQIGDRGLLLLLILGTSEYRSAMSELGHAPEFGPLGQEPPIRSPMALIAEEFYFSAVRQAADGSVPPVEILRGSSTIELSNELIKAKAWLSQRETPTLVRSIGTELAATGGITAAMAAPVIAGAVIAGPIGAIVGLGAGLGAGYLAAKRDEKYRTAHGRSRTSMVAEVRRIRVYQRWMRDSPITQLAPGSSASREVEIVVGVSEQTTLEIGAQMGIGKLTPANLSGQVSARISEVLTLTRQEKLAFRINLDNSGDKDQYRIFAIWHVEDTIEVDALQSNAGALTWKRLAGTSFAPSESAVLTSREIPIRR